MNFGLPPAVTLEPADELNFQDKLGHVGAVTLLIKNKNMWEIYFKVKSTASKFYAVRPATGTIKPHSQTKVIIQPHDDKATSLDIIETKKHRFMVQSAYVDHNNQMPAEHFWKCVDQNSQEVATAKLRAKVFRIQPSKKNVAETDLTFKQQEETKEKDVNEVKKEELGNGAGGAAFRVDVKDEKSEEQKKVEKKNEPESSDEVKMPEKSKQEIEQNEAPINKHLADVVAHAMAAPISPSTPLVQQPFDTSAMSVRQLGSPPPQHLALVPAPNLFNTSIYSHFLNQATSANYDNDGVNQSFGRYVAKMLDNMSNKGAASLKKEINELIAKYEQQEIE